MDEWLDVVFGTTFLPISFLYSQNVAATDIRTHYSCTIMYGVYHLRVSVQSSGLSTLHVRELHQIYYVLLIFVLFFFCGFFFFYLHISCSCTAVVSPRVCTVRALARVTEFELDYYLCMSVCLYVCTCVSTQLYYSTRYQQLQHLATMPKTRAY